MHRYSLAGHASMLTDAVRIGAYARAIAHCVRPGAAVLEIGTGTGLFAVLACRAGARRVYAVEADDVIEVARANAAANGVEGRIEFLHALSTEVELPERVDVIVSDLRGILPLYERHLPSIIDARTRLLAPGGRLVPRRDRIVVAVVEAPARHAGIVGPWDAGVLDVALPAAAQLVVNDLHKASFEPGEVISGPACWAEIDYASVASADVAGSVRLRVARDGVGHGLAAWFETTLCDDVEFGTGPGARERATIYGQAFLPWPQPREVAAGEEVEVALQARLVSGEYVWRWQTRHRGDRLEQSSWLAEPLSAARLARRSADHVATPGVEADIDLAILSAMRSGRTLGEVAREIAARWPERFARPGEALARVGELSERYSGLP